MTYSRLLAVGDIHGQAEQLAALLDVVKPVRGDRLIFLGDYVDTGPDSCAVLDRVVELHRDVGAVALRGNHDEVMLNVLDDTSLFASWATSQGRQTVASYGGSDGPVTPGVIEQRHGPFLRSLAFWHEEPEAIFVHASVDPSVEMSLQDPLTLIWQKHYGPALRHLSGKIVVCGHTPQKNGIPRDRGWTLCIDTDAKSGGPLTCLDVVARVCWQAMPSLSVLQFSLGQTG